jgi:uncharacterized protein (DUF2252 family)
MIHVPFEELAAMQRRFDRHATRRLPVTFQLKRQKMLGSPHAFLRGSTPLFYELLHRRPDLRAPLPGRGWIDGDMHLENFGAFRTDDGRVIFDLNDFDEAVPAAPWSDDLLRLSASCFLSAGFTGLAGAHVVDMVETLLEAHSRAAFSRTPPRPPRLPDPIAFLIARAETRTKRHMLDVRAPVQKGQRRFRLGDKYLRLSPAVQRATPKLLADNAEQLAERRPGPPVKFELLDAAQRISGVGSLGVARIAALVRSRDKLFLYDLKEARAAAMFRGAERASTRALEAAGIRTDAERVVAGARAMLTAPPRRQRALWSAHLRLSFVARQFTPSEDRVDLEVLAPGELGNIVTTLGHLLGRAHRRAASELPRKSWSESERRALVRRAGELAALIHGAYLASAFLERGDHRAFDSFRGGVAPV